MDQYKRTNLKVCIFWYKKEFLHKLRKNNILQDLQRTIVGIEKFSQKDEVAIMEREREREKV